MRYGCGSCGYEARRWMGFCPRCGAASPLIERPDHDAAPAAPVRLIPDPVPELVAVGVGEVDDVLGGGLVPGSVVLLGGEPGVGKSTLVLQLAAAAARNGVGAFVATAEESVGQVAARAGRLGLDGAGVDVVAERDLGAVLAAAAAAGPALLVVDSVQTMHLGDVDGTAGGVNQVRECAARLAGFARASGTAVVLVGHVTKDGSLAGPKSVEHLVDVVLVLEGEAEHGLRALRGLKNRFGPTDRTGLFRMTAAGLAQLPDPSAAAVAGWAGSVAGTVAFPAVAGRRPVVVEVQALVTPAPPQATPQRSVKGLDPARVRQIVAVLERHAGLDLRGADVFVGVSNGVRVREPACDLALALALASSVLDVALGRCGGFGEVGLTGEVRPVPHDERRRRELQRVGIERVIAPASDRRGHLGELLAAAGLVAVVAKKPTLFAS